jgi:peptide/nickel transport system permease protein
MATFIFRRIVMAIPTLLLASVGIFFLLRLIPGDPAVTLAGSDASPEALALIRQDLGLDQPIPVQYLAWLKHVATGDLGKSIQARRPVTDLIGLAFPATLELVIAAMAISILLGGTLGTLAALKRGTWVDVVISSVNAMVLGVPNFWMGLVAIMFFALVLGWLPPGGRVDPFQDPIQGLRTLVLPSAVLALGLSAVITRFTRAAMLEVLSEGFIRTAHAKGLAPAVVISRHVLRNALIPVVTVIGVQTGHLLGGAVIIETVFAWPGMGRVVANAVSARDYPVVQGVLLLLVVGFVTINLIVDLAYGFLDPRIRVAK